MTAFFMVAIGLASVFGNPVSGAIMQYLDTVLGLHGWQWLFLLEGMPSVVLGFVVLVYLTDYPKDATWLSTRRTRLAGRSDAARGATTQQRHNADRLGAILQWRVWLLIAIYFTVAVGANAGGAYFPKLIKAQFTTASTFQIGLLSALPPLCSVLGMTLFGISSDRRNERRGHLAAAALMAAIGWSLTAWAPSPVVAFAGTLPCSDGNDEHVAGVLDVADRVPDRCGGGGWNRNDQLRRQHRRISGCQYSGKFRTVVDGRNSVCWEQSW